MTRPYKAKVTLAKGQKEYAYYIRKNSSSVAAKGSDERELLSLTAIVPFDDRYNQKARVEELDIGLIKNSLEEVGSSLASDVDNLSLEKMTEGRSTGIHKILDAMSSNGSPKPEFEFDEEHTYFQVKLPVHIEVLKENIENSDFTPQVENLLSILDKEMSRVEIMESLGLEDRKNFRTLYLNPAIEFNLVRLTTPDKPRSSKQKYRITSLGKRLMGKDNE